MISNAKFDSLRQQDIYSLMLFVLYKLKDDANYSTVSELAYLLNKEDLLTLCEFYGGQTITVPTIVELECILNALLMFEKVDLRGESYNKVVNEFSFRDADKQQLINAYEAIKYILKDYKFTLNREVK